jgi:hypothetical protein
VSHPAHDDRKMKKIAPNMQRQAQRKSEVMGVFMK